MIVTGALAVSLAVTAFGDTQAQTQRASPAARSRLVAAQNGGELRILDWTIWYVSRYYVEPRRIDPARMTLAGLEALEKTVPEVLVEPIARGKRVRIRVGTAEREFPVADIELWAVGPHIQEVFQFVTENSSLDEEARRKAEYAIVGGVLSTLDPHTNLLRPDDFEDMKASTKGSFGGLGIEVGLREGTITVIRVLDGNPASKVDMQPGDRIVQINEQSTVTMNLNDAVGLLRGPPGTTVAVYVMREGLAKPRRLEITRATIKLDSVVGDVLTSRDAKGNERKVGVVQIPRNFAQTTGRELRKKLDEFESEGVEGVVLDLRDNPGGLLNAAVEVADAFLSSGTIVSTVGSNPEDREENAADSRYDFPNLPLVVLVDQGSASASEIVAGALRNLGRAVLIGRRTFGKGSVQVLHERKTADSRELALKLTIAQYLTPGDVSIQSVGVSPDLETIPVYVGKELIQFFGRTRFDLLREESLASHLESSTATTQKIEHGPLYFLDRGSLAPEGEKTVAEKAGADARSKVLLADPEIRIANQLLLWAPSASRADILGNMNAWVPQQAAAEQTLIATSLGERKIDWSPGPNPAKGQEPRLRAEVTSDKLNNVIRGGETGVITVKISNDGPSPAYQVRAITDSDYRYFDERELLFGRINPGETREFLIKLSVGEHELSRTDRIDVHLFEQHGAKLARDSQTSIDVSAEGLPRPRFAFGYQIVDDPRYGRNITGNGDGALQVGERVRLRVDVSNLGDGPALETWVTLRNLAGDAVFLHTGRHKLETIQPGDARMVELDLELRRRPPEDEGARLQLTVSDNKIAEVLSEKILFPVYTDVPRFSGAKGIVSSIGAIDLVASPLAPERVIARTEAGARFKNTGTSGNWVRVELDRGLFGFARDTDVKDATGRAKPKFERHLEVSPPGVTLMGSITQTDAESVHISGAATDDSAVRDVFVTVYNPSRDWMAGREKVFYQASPDPGAGRLEFAADIPLTPGNNLIEINARENDDVIGVKRMWVLRTSGLAKARAKDAKLNSSGKLRVDTFK